MKAGIINGLTVPVTVDESETYPHDSIVFQVKLTDLSAALQSTIEDSAKAVNGKSDRSRHRACRIR